ncbi:MAG: PEGA domain-containing protein [Bradymonadales bacterium]|nr:PEGA domain-containing protein [Bradymonadales bacterium]
MWRSTGWSDPLAIALTSLVLLLPVFGVRAQPDQDQAQTLYEQARESFARGHYVEAAELFGQVFEIDPHPAILYNQARCFQELGDLPRALGLFQQALQLDPNERVRSEVQDRIEAIRQRLVDLGFHLSDLDPAGFVDLVKLSVTSLPDGAMVILDGEPIGATPIEYLYIIPGMYQLEVRLEEYQSHLRTIEVEPGRNLSVHAGLRRLEGLPSYQPPLPGIIEVVGPVSGMAVYLDNDLLGETPVGATEIPPGRYLLTVRHPAFMEWTSEVTVQSGDTARIFADAERITGPMDEEGFPYRDWGIGTVVSGGLVVVTGVVFGVLAKADADRYHRNTDVPDRADIRDLASTEALVADLCFGVGVGLLATSLVFFLLDGREPPQEEWPGITDDLVLIDIGPGEGGWTVSIGIGIGGLF